jgi:hypothetical protein
LHSKVELASLESKLKLAEVAVVVVGGDAVIDVLGGVMSGGEGSLSIVQDTLAGD